MSQPMDDPLVGTDPSDPLHRFQRVSRLAVKELREILRDRRTLLTLILMPLLLYPLLSLVLRKFMFEGGIPTGPPTYAVACDTENESNWVQWMVQHGRPVAKLRVEGESLPQFTFFVAKFPDHDQAKVESERALHAGQVDVVVRITRFPPEEPKVTDIWELDCEFVIVKGSVSGERATRCLEDCFRAVGARFFARRLEGLGIQQRPSPVRVTRQILEGQGKASVVSLSALIPFVLILMTITGAVYPAIDLTAGERERGTLELLIAAPVPRLGLLFAKYVAVLAVAMLTATVNLFAMAATISLSGLGPMVWGERGLSFGIVLAVFGLLFLLASFFSAVLLTITSFARSFKEAQAYLIPLMLFALGPGLISLMPGVELKGWLVVTPLLNVAILSRDLLAGDASVGLAIVVVIATALYSFAALGIASKLFAAENVLSDARLGWRDMWKRPSHPGTASPAVAVLCLACMFPVSFAALGGIGNLKDTSLSARLAFMALATAVVYGGVPFLFAHRRHITPEAGLSLRMPKWSGCIGAVLLGLSLWPFAHEIVLLSQTIGFASLKKQQLDMAQQFIDQARQAPLWLFVLAIAVAPAVFEEFCFRGLVFGAFKSRWPAFRAIVVSGLLFGVFHLVTSDALAVERLLPSTGLGCLLGWICWKTGSLLPSVLTHATHNGVLALMIYYLPELKSRGWGVEDRSHLPATWLIAAAIGVVAGWLLVRLGGRREGDENVK